MNSKKIQYALVLATNNQHKVSEIRSILRKAHLKVPILTLKDFPSRGPVVENKPTLVGNAVKKAREISRFTKCLALADDTGLFVKALRGKPGVYSARFAGPGCNYEHNCRKLLRLLNGKPLSKRQALFQTVAALALPNGKVFVAKGQVNGRIATEFKGKNGFGYDPVFNVPKYKKTFAEMNPHLKNRISHRAKAFSKVPGLLKKALKEYNSR
ncbi:non-canonical purine NTP pyrophosphatase, RdgB/HAM1 family [bacterium F11]|nr:non-canonical purine NTP pyrophosphatase, RdgB/HAM1 family [bacterium F11]